jgi:hypothetical protein
MLLETGHRVKQKLPGATSMFIVLMCVIVTNVLKSKDCKFFNAPYFLTQDLSRYSTVHVPFMEIKISSLSINKTIKYLVLPSFWT